MQVTRGTCTGLQQAHQQQHHTVIEHLQQEGSDQGLCGCSCCTNHLRYRHHLLGCGSNRQVIMLRSEGLGVPLGALEGLGVLLGGSGGLVAAKFVKCPKSYYTEQFV